MIYYRNRETLVLQLLINCWYQLYNLYFFLYMSFHYFFLGLQNELIMVTTQSRYNLSGMTTAARAKTVTAKRAGRFLPLPANNNDLEPGPL